jgi:malate dehydrogenase (oxaloacetate-decarboxylating)
MDDKTIEPRGGRRVIRVAERGSALLHHPAHNRGTAFSPEERRTFGLEGMLPDLVSTLGLQVERIHRSFMSKGEPLEQYIGLVGLQDRNEVLFYRLLLDHIETYLPVVYTPTVGLATQRYSEIFRRARGVWITPRHRGRIAEVLANAADRDKQLLVVTDAERILGLGDQGAGGMAIPIGKLALYTVGAGIEPRLTLPVCLDVGTDNETLLANELYLGYRARRLRGAEYDSLVEEFVEAVREVFPRALLQWEDFKKVNAMRLLERYRHRLLSFNDDIQGTAAVVLAAIMAGVDVTGHDLTDHRIVIFGAGNAGIGIAQLVRERLVRGGLTQAEALDRFYAIGINGLYVDDQTELMGFQKPYARRREEVAGWSVKDPRHITLEEVVREARPTILIGTSTRGGAFSREVVQAMAEHSQRPIIMPLSNPTSRAEATPADVLEWTDGRALVATGSPFGAVDHGGVRYQIAQANNALIFPGLGLGVAACRATRVTEGMVGAAADALAGLVNAYRPGASLLPSLADLRMVSATVAVAVARAAEAEGVASAPLTDPVQQVFARMWQPEYPPIEAI